MSNFIFAMKATNIIHDVMISAAEREIHTGDAICFNIITKVGNRAVQTFSFVGVVLVQNETIT